MASVCWLPVFLLSTAYPTLALAGFWTVHIENGAAPSPEDGPPLSRTASRDRALLPGQICGILGAYVLFVLIVGTAFLTVGRRLRRTAGTSREAPAIEMVKTVTGAFDISPVSPSSSHRTWRAWHSPHSFAFGSKKGNAPSLKSVKSNSESPGINSILSFDNNVIEADKAKRQDEMERLYAAVMAQEDSKFRVVHSSQEVEIREDEIRQWSGELPPPPTNPPVDRRRPPRLLTSAPALAHLQIPIQGPPSPSSPGSPRSPITPRSPMRAIYPPDSSMPDIPSTPTSPLRVEYPPKYAPRSPTAERHRYPSSGAPLSSRANRASSYGSVSSASGARHGLRNLRITPPRQKYSSQDGGSYDEARTPLTPRHGDSGLPPSPLQASPAPTTPGTSDGYDYEGLDKPQPLPRPAPQRLSSHPYNQSLSTSSAAPTNSSTSIGTLPFRSLSASVNNELTSPTSDLPSTKTTYVERRRDLFMQGPRTGLATPYSPYMPFTPLTPVTPHLTSRRERKQRIKDEGRRIVTEEDEVQAEAEIWGSAY